jgi:hypothetical protein
MKNRIGHQVKNRSLPNREEVKEVCNYEANPSIYPLFEKYSFISPYNYCANNSVNKIDSTGMEDWIPDNDGNLAAEAGVQ